VEIILTHNNADFDAVASLLGAHKLYPAAVPVLPQRLNHSVAEFITLYQNGLPFVRWDDFRPRQIDRVILVDTQKTLDVRNLQPGTPTLIIDHHPPGEDLGPHVTFSGDEVGAAATLLVEQIRRAQIPLTSLEATLLTLGIYVDTGALTYGTTTPRDLLAAAWLLEQNAVLDTVRRFMSPPLNDAQRALFDVLVSSSESRAIQGYTVLICSARVDEYIEQINSVAHRLRDILEPEALFIVVEMPHSTQLVCRSNGDAVDVGEIAREFGGGGHGRAAAATVADLSLDETVERLWSLLEERVRPVSRVADLMSYGVQTVHAGDRIVEIIGQLRRIGHEGYPVIEADGQVVGLLTRRDADRAIEHGLKEAAVRDVMSSGEITLRPDDTVNTLEQRMVESDWGQIPVVDDSGELIGIVTRTDLIKHWARVHPATAPPEDYIEPERIAGVLGGPVAGLINAVAEHARQKQINLYLVGGVVRDLLLGRANLDIDFVVEDDAIHLARELCAVLGGEISSYRPFGTAKWKLNAATIAALELPPEAIRALPSSVDFATSRNEFYEHPTALPSVYNGSIKLDLHRRDFTINTLAVQLSPAPMAYRLLDFYGGLGDLRGGLIRVLHSLSFVDDPTRILRAVRFEQRLGFRIEHRTAELIRTSLPMLRRITGERLRNELTLLLREPEPERALLILQERGILAAIHPALSFDVSLAAAFQAARTAWDEFPASVDALEDIYWHLIAAHLPLDEVADVCERLVFGRRLTDSMTAAAGLAQEPGLLAEAEIRPSQIAAHLDDMPELALVTGWLLLADRPRERIRRYLEEWRHIRPAADGNTLKALGLPTGPRYSEILERLRAARLDGEIRSDDEERQLLDDLLRQGE
jgi:tRNA nucleotidyltransferase (CCA-adding enzyme)